jgi:hypothetical protein
MKWEQLNKIKMGLMMKFNAVISPVGKFRMFLSHRSLFKKKYWLTNVNYIGFTYTLFYVKFKWACRSECVYKIH